MPTNPGTIPASDVLAHRGLWEALSEQNTQAALRRALRLGFGIETDIRDHGKDLVISHDVPKGSETPFRDLLSWCSGQPGLVALNVKADGLQTMLKEQLSEDPPLETFLFDMSLPQARLVEQAELPFAARLSEFEPIAGLLRGPYARAGYLWIDCFESDWFLDDAAVPQVLTGRVAVLVSPEIHGRNPEDAWIWLRSMRSRAYRVGLCTDRPLEFMAWQSGRQGQ